MSDQSSAPLRRPQLHALTSTRFFAALCIVVLHAENHGLLSLEFLQIFDLSKAVSFFFVLSGFVLGYANDGRAINPWRFYQARFARIWPVTILSIFFVLLILPKSIYLPSSSSSWSSGFVLLLNFLCLQAFFPVPDVFFSFNAVAWSISVEVFFYFCFPFVHLLKSKSLFLITVSYSFLVLLSAYLLTFSSLTGFSPESLNIPVWQGLVYINPFARMPEFLMGVLLSRLFLSRQFLAFKYFYDRANVQNWFLVDFFEVLAVVFSVWFGFRSHSLSLPLTLQISFNQLMSGLFFCLLILVLANSSGMLDRFFKWPPLLLLGQVSFGLYLFHQPIMIKAAQLSGWTLAGFQVLPPHFSPVLAWSLLASFACYFFFELPLQELLRPRGS